MIASTLLQISVKTFLITETIFWQQEKLAVTINLDESLISGSGSNVTVRKEENHLNGNNRFITDNRKVREKYKQKLNHTKQTVTTVKKKKKCFNRGQTTG